MEIIRLAEADPDRVLQLSFDALMQGGIIAFPAETFYGMAVKYDHALALERLYALKNRPKDKAMPLIIGHKRLLNLVAENVPPAAELLMEQFWPGPLTLILTAQKTLSPHITAGTGRVAVRIPGRSFALTLASALDFPITATSANISSQPPADTAEAVFNYFGANLDILIDGGKTAGSLPSTIVDTTGIRPVIVRKGILSEKEIFRALHA